jgi:hypothetical protein
MKQLPLAHDLLQVARGVIWFAPPEEALADPIHFVTYLMAYGTSEDIAVVSRYLDLDDFREALENASPGICDEKSWARWNAMVGRNLPMPVRIIPD